MNQTDQISWHEAVEIVNPYVVQIYTPVKPYL